MKLIRQLILRLTDLELQVSSLYGEENLNQPSVFHIELLVDYAINTDLWLGVTAELQFCFATGELIQKTLVVTSVSAGDAEKHHQAVVSMILESPLGLLRYSLQPRVFLNQNKLTVIKHVLMDKGLFSARQCHFHLAKSYPTVAMIIQLYHESDVDFLQRLLAEAQLFYWLEGLDIHISDQVLYCPRVTTPYHYNPDGGLIYRCWSEHQADKTVCQMNSYLAMIIPGQILTVDDTDYVVTGVKHYIKQAAALNDKALPYWNQLSLQSCSGAKLLPDKPELTVPWCFQATVESPSESACLDEQGRYRVKFLFDPDEDSKALHSEFIPRLQFYGDDQQGSQAVGAHFPLYDGTEVLINCIEGDVYRPIILGALASSEHPSVVSRAYPNKNVMETAKGCGLVLDDQAQQSTLYTPGNHLLLDQGRQKIELFTELGDISFHSKQDTTLQQGAAAKTQVNGHLAITADQAAVITQAQQDLSLQSAKDLSVVAGGDLLMQAAVLKLNALDELIVSAVTVKKLLQQGRQIWQVKNTLVMKSKKIQIQSESLLVLSCMNTAIEIRPDKISFFSKAIGITARESRLQAKYSDFNDQACQSFKVSSMKSLLELKPLPFIQDEQDLVVIDCQWSRPEARIDEDILAQCFVENIGDQVSGTLIVYCEDHQLVAKQSFSIADVRMDPGSKYARLEIPWRVSESAASQRLAYQHSVTYYFDVEIDGTANQAPSTALQILIDLALKASYQDLTSVPDESIMTVTLSDQRSSLVLVRDGKALARNIVLGQLELSLAIRQADQGYLQQMIYADQQREPWMTLPLKLPADLKTQTTVLKSLFPPVFVQFDDQPETGIKPSVLLSAAILAELKRSCRQQPANITLFIHGYDVEPGKLGQCIKSVEREDLFAKIQRTVNLFGKKDDGLTVDFSEVDATVYQEFEKLRKRFPRIKPKDSDFLARYSVNGSGDHAWLLAIEHYINKACGLDQHGYDYYQRLIGVCWPAVPDNALDYIQVTERIRLMGQKTAGLIKQLLQAGFEVNAVAHSLGCGVLMQALNQLGQENVTKTVNHCFLWEAAVPNTIFSRRGYDLLRDKASVQLLMEKDVWYVPYAQEAATQFVVLHSENDNVLGPLPAEQPPGRSQYYVNAQKPFFDELVPAVLLTFLGLESLYDVSMALNIPTREMLRFDGFARIYKQWWQRYQPIRDKKGRFYPDTLDKRIAQLTDPEFLLAKHWISDQYKRNKAIIQRYLRHAQQACTEAGYIQREEYTVLEKLVDYLLSDTEDENDAKLPESIPYLTPSQLDGKIGRAMAYDMGYGFYVELPILLNSVFLDNDLEYPCALGYRGADTRDAPTSQLLASGKLKQIDQTDCLFSHSGMKDPSRDLFHKIYQQAIWQQRDGMRFGGY